MLASKIVSLFTFPEGKLWQWILITLDMLTCPTKIPLRGSTFQMDYKMLKKRKQFDSGLYAMTFGEIIKILYAMNMTTMLILHFFLDKS